MRQFPELMRMDQSLSFAPEPLFFIGRQSSLFNLLHLEPQHIFTFHPVGDIVLSTE